jgi:diaminohydroxyphosphoribosylaminopyrimidine deaminase/5-amino-6-(5-phosphoribosylamino)uracil reductase
MWTKTDRRFMQLALGLAWTAKGRTSPNPAVGAVVVKNGEVISTGTTQPAGEDHAERAALKDLPIKISEGSTLYVSLEPCCFTGKTPPCTELILEKKIKRVVIATLDPNPKIMGEGVRILKDAGVEVQTGLREREAVEINLDFFHWIQHKKPFVSLKYAMTLDGKISALSGDSKWITSLRARRLTHLLRYRSDAILVGVNTVVQDNPLLNVRLPGREKTLLRVILDPSGRTPLSSRVVQDKLPSLFVIKGSKPIWKQEVLKNPSNEIWTDQSGGREIDLNGMLDFLGKEKKIVSLFVEGGGKTLGLFLKQKVGNRVFTFVGNQIMGDGISPFSGFQVNEIKNAVVLDDIQYKKLGSNILIYGKLEWKKEKAKGKDTFKGD